MAARSRRNKDGTAGCTDARSAASWHSTSSRSSVETSCWPYAALALSQAASSQVGNMGDNTGLRELPLRKLSSACSSACCNAANETPPAASADKAALPGCASMASKTCSTSMSKCVRLSARLAACSRLWRACGVRRSINAFRGTDIMIFSENICFSFCCGPVARCGFALRQCSRA